MEEIFKTIQKDIDTHPILLYMKGTKLMPLCGFSAKVVEVLNRLGVPYVTRNVLDDESLRQGLKTFSNWPTFPQLYVRGELIGGCDIVLELDQNGSLIEILQDA